MIKISVIIPVYNVEKYLRECLDSVLSQTLKEIEIICVDDGSTDCSYDILKEYGKKYRNIIVLHQENQGSGPARNKGMEQAVGKYFCFMDADDYYVQRQALEKLFTVAEENNVLVCGGNMIAVSDDEKKREKDWFSKKERKSFKDDGCIYGYTRYIFRSEIILKNHITFPRYRRYQDPPFLLNAMVHAQEFYSVDEVIYAHRKKHKEVNFNFEVTLDLLKAIKDCFKTSQENNLISVHERCLKYVLFEYLPIIYKYADQSKIWELISEINEICKKWLGETLDIFIDKKSLEEYVTNLKSKREKMIFECQKAQEVVIYGAGVAGEFFLENYGKECKHIAGFAVSKKNIEEAFDKGYEVKEITEYSRKALIVVAVSQKYAEEILQNLERLQFENICYVEYAGLKLLEKL